jgi:starvation-inducible DNA-binding protein
MASKSKNGDVKTGSVNIGLSGNALEVSIDALTEALANTFVLYTKTRKYHWNVTGMHFAELHEFFEEQYDLLEASMDEIAERIRQLGAPSIGTLKEFAENTKIKEQPGNNPDAAGMVRDLLSDHELCIRELRDAIDKTAKAGDMGTNDFLTGLMEGHEKMAWMLRAHLE